jgi:tetratricopeptide (TPR) repeat protein
MRVWAGSSEPSGSFGVFCGMNGLRTLKRWSACLVLFVTVLLSSGCASLVSNAANRFADNLSAAIVNQNDPQTVRDGAPAYLLLLDSLIEGSPDDPALLAAAANMYASYGAVFAGDPERAKRLTDRARSYGFKAMCISFKPACNWRSISYDDFVATLAELSEKHADVVYAYGLASLAYIRTHSDDFNALARLPHAEALLTRYLEIDDGEMEASVYVYLGILATIRPPALGGEPEKGRAAFERAIELTDGKDLSAKVEFARGYARLLYERELHDELLKQVLAADPNVDGFTLTNVMAQQDAVALLASADDYF